MEESRPLDEVALRLRDIATELMEIADTLGASEVSDITLDMIHSVALENITRQLDYIKRWHDDKDGYTAEKLRINVREIEEEWRTGRSLPSPRNGWALKLLYDEERRLHGEPEE